MPLAALGVPCLTSLLSAASPHCQRLRCFAVLILLEPKNNIFFLISRNRISSRSGLVLVHPSRGRALRAAHDAHFRGTRCVLCDARASYSQLPPGCLLSAPVCFDSLAKSLEQHRCQMNKMQPSSHEPGS